MRNISQVATAIAPGDLERKIAVDVKGEILELKNTINTMVDQLRAFAEQVKRVAREVGIEGKLGGQASVEGVRGVWKDLTDNVNLMASNLTNQVRDISAGRDRDRAGDLGRKVSVEVRGELLDLKNVINTMVDQAVAVRRRGDARRPRRRRRGQARRPGRGARRRRHLEGAHRQRQPDGVEPDQPGPRHRRA